MDRTQRATDAFLEATRRLADAVEARDAALLPACMARQLECFEALRARVGPKDELLSPELAAAVTAAEGVLSTARRQLRTIRQELARVRQSRAAAARLRSSEPSARFISRRV